MSVRSVTTGLLIVCSLSLAACGVDVGSNDSAFSVGVKNNLAETVILGACSRSCGPFLDTWTVKPGHVVSTTQDPDGVSRPIEVLSTSRTVLGCLPFRFRKTPSDGISVSVRKMVPCGNSAGTKEAMGRDWPLPQS
jgi:hypothetical protein